MASSRQTTDYLAEQMGMAGDITTRAMFGEYAAYCDGKVVAFICDDQLFVKPTEAGRTYLGDEIEEAPPYPGAKDYFLIAGDRCENRDWLGALIRTTADALPAPKPKPEKRKQKR
jgi:DNA transformation protein